MTLNAGTSGKNTVSDLRIVWAIELMHIKEWRLIPWIESYPGGCEFTFLFIAVIRELVDFDDFPLI